MIHVAAAVLLLAVQEPDSAGEEPDTTALPPTAAQLADAYEDDVARQLVQGARERRRTVDRSIETYSAVARERIWGGLRALGLDRTLYRRDTVTRIDWKREGPIHLEVLGAREVIPPVQENPQIPSRLRNAVPDLAFDPVNSEILLRMDEEVLRNPLAGNGERYYRYRSGDTTEIRLPDGRAVEMVELRILPRFAAFHLLRGSFWMEQETNAVVQAVVRPSRAFDLEEDGEEDVPGLLEPIRLEIDYITLEYAFWDFRWWLPRTLAVEGVAQATSLLKTPFGYSRSYSDYRVEGDTAQAPNLETQASGEQPCEPDADSADEGGRRRRERIDEETGLGKDRCGRVVQVDLPADSAALLTSEYLPAPIHEADADWEAELRRVRQLAKLLGAMEEAPWRHPDVELAWGPGGPGLLRYNRVEGLSVGARAELDLGRLQFDATGRLALAEPRPDIELGVTRPTFDREYRLSIYNGVRDIDPTTRAFGIGNSFNALVLGRDDGEYYQALGASLEVRRPLTRPQWYTLRLYAERQDAVQTETDFSIPSIFDGDRSFRPNILADKANLFGGNLLLSGGLGSNPAGWHGNGILALEGAGGDFEFARASATLRTGFPLPGRLSGSVEAAAGSSVGDVPVQRLFYLGGPFTLRGYDGNAARGNAFWRTRAEVALGFPAARLALFGDVGWAGDRDAFGTDGRLRSAGLGATFLDGLIRADLARALDEPKGWRLDLWVNVGGS